MPPAHDNEILVTIHDVSRGGEGVGRLDDGRIVFVRYTTAGDRVRARVLKAKKKFVQAELLEILQPAPDRIKAPCPVFGICGGCEWQHLDYAKQWAIKRRGISEVLTRFGIVYEGVIDEFPATTVWAYRNRIQLRGEGSQVGFFAHRSNQLVPIKDCALAHPAINDYLDKIRNQGFVGPYKVEIEVRADSQISASWNQAHASRGFRQVHDGQNSVLKKWVSEQIVQGESVWDLFGGDGNLSLPLLAQAKVIHCVDVGAFPDSSLVPKNYFYHRSSVETWLAGQLQKPASLPEGLVIILDPPRQGATEVIQLILELSAKTPIEKIIMISCFPDTWARDIKQLLDKRWKINRMGVLDFFPQTHHVEVFSELEPLC